MRAGAMPRSEMRIEELRELTDAVAGGTIWRPLVRFAASGRWWTRLPTDADADVWLLTWLTGHATDLHDHDDSAAAFTVVEGALDEIRPTPDGPLTRRTVQPGMAATVAPGVVHDVRNPYRAPAVSIHAYAPRLTVMNFYRPGVAGLRRVRSTVTTEPDAEAPS